MRVLPLKYWTAFEVWRLCTPWLAGRKWYQYIDFGNGLTTEKKSAGDAYLRTTSFLSFLQNTDLIKADDVVLDIGCNAGLFSLVAATRCKHVYGMEVDARFARQAEFLKKWWEGDSLECRC